VNRRCAIRRSACCDDREIRITVEVYVRPHPSVQLTTARALMILLQELADDRVPVRLMRVALSGRLWGGADL
jgi:hypothetical protein